MYLFFFHMKYTEKRIYNISILFYSSFYLKIRAPQKGQLQFYFKQNIIIVFIIYY